MDDYNINSIVESKNEWCARLTNILTPCIIEGVKSVFDESYKMCIENDEESKYLMTFQNLLNNIPKWSSEIIENEKDRIIASSCCNYLEDLITCVHITQLKSLTVSRVGLKQKKVNIDVPNLNTFIHKTYVNVARKIYVNVYLFEKDIMPLQIQKNNREMEIIVKECILNTIRENIPIENILRTYLDETQETDVEVEEVREQIVDEEALKQMKKEEKRLELESIKKEVKEKMKKESEDSVKKALKEANKALNTDEVIKSDSVKADGLDNDYTTDEESIADSVISNEKLIIDDLKDDKLEFDLGIKSLDDDPDKLDLDVLDLDVKTEKGEPDNLDLELDIEELT